ncbi:MAG TPA: gephyrin-like molybdotransferase Glp [Acidimicrobiales bacterium]|nr:gephyrin-like molybdotransferase Glp [Acidimicrobiales bacterium]
MAHAARPGPTVSLAQARRQLLAELAPLKPHRVPLDEALGCALAEAVVAAEDVPPFANSAMDGFAVQAEDARRAPSRLQLIGAVTAGGAPDGPLGPGQAMAIATGAPLPAGSDAVCVMEQATVEGAEVVLEAMVASGENVRYPGEDIARGSSVFGPSIVIGPSHIGVLASIGVSEVSVHPRARVGVLSTGDELHEGPGPLRFGQINDSNRHALLAAARGAGCDVVNLGVVGDDEQAIAGAIEGGIGRCDAILTSGGVSVGVADHMKTVLGRLSGGAVRWMEVAIKPAKPFGFAVLAPSGLPVLCMPGNPVSAMVSFELLARPALRYLMGHAALDRPAVLGRTEERLRRHDDGKLHFVRVVARIDAEGILWVRPSGGQGSHQLRAMAEANALAIVPDGVSIDAGQPVRVVLVDPDAVSGTEVPS